MSFSKWLRGATRLRLDSRTLSNLVKNAAVGAGSVVGGPLGLAIGGLGSAAGRGLAKGANFGNILKSGLTGAATSGALHSAGGLLKNAVGGIGGGAGGGAAAGGAVPQTASGISLNSGAIGPAIDPANILASATANPANAALASSSSSGLLGGLKSAGGNVLKFAKDNPSAVGMGLQAAGGLATAGSENRMNEAQTDLLEQRADETRYDFEQRKRREQQYAPIWSALGTGVANRPIAPNPYLAGV